MNYPTYFNIQPIEIFLTDCGKRRTKVITLTNQKGHRHWTEAILNSNTKSRKHVRARLRKECEAKSKQINVNYLDVTKTGNGERATGNGERESGNQCTAVTRLRIQHGGQRKKKRCG